MGSSSGRTGTEIIIQHYARQGAFVGPVALPQNWLLEAMGFQNKLAAGGIFAGYGAGLQINPR